MNTLPRSPIGHPYRSSGAVGESTHSPCDDERALYALCLCIGAIPVGCALLGSTPWGAEPTFGLLLTLCAARALASSASRGSRPSPRGE
ncbi:MAG: hypothetical protein R3A52_16195 [Polyangiales bacterium]